MTGVVSNRNPLALSVHRSDIIRQTLSRLAHNVDIHTVGTCTDHTAQACGTELKLCVETLLYLIFVICDRAQFCFCVLIEIRIV